MPLPQVEARKLIGRRSPEWEEQHLRWRFLLDSLEGGERYRQAVYGIDLGGMPVRNLIRHKHEYPDPRDYEAQLLNGATYIAGSAMGLAGAVGGPAAATDQAQYAGNSDYELRRARTPVPSFVSEVVETYVSKVFASNVDRDSPYPVLADWWEDVDGRGTGMDDWVSETVAPLLLTLGQLDLVFDHPPAPPDTRIVSRADSRAAGLTRCVASYVLPDNMVWWRLDPLGVCYLECLHLAYPEGEDEVGEGAGPRGLTRTAPAFYRHWTADETTLYDGDGKVVETAAHPFGCVPIVRVFDRRKVRTRNVGQPLLECAAEIQREYYNRDSELILSDTLQAHPLLQGPEDLVDADGRMPVGPGFYLPMKKASIGGAPQYAGFSYVDVPKGAAESIRQNKHDLRESLDRKYCLLKPAGAAGKGGAAVSQSGVSKSFDHDGLYAKLSGVAKTLQKAELAAARMALTVLTDGHPPDAGAVTVAYPTVFSLHSADELAMLTADFQANLAAAGAAPETESLFLTTFLAEALKGRADDEYEALDAEVTAAVAAKAKAMAQAAEGPAAAGTAAGADAKDDPQVNEQDMAQQGNNLGRISISLDS